ncbi:hypothetical protein C8R26_1525 [Nitrosomonas oligotropha]|uniref:Uncharacterized protein n=1 Tax=Nitrosomonas oligotropha TaxID=42354 RepID=A0A2T5H431_9PROT|nr:hypothetical protein [Nitrosomonas oligotropha]PTQ66371.1 hypothetical protein C8R26_1525 [Nitrosomonas oligotropha]
MTLPEALQGDTWTKETARAVLPILIWCAKNGRTITYGQLDQEIVNRGLGHHVMAVQYGYPAGAIGSALIETEIKWGEPIPPLNAIVVNAGNGLPGKGVNYYLERYYEPDMNVDDMSEDEKRAVVEEIHEDIFAYERWDDILNEYGFFPIRDGVMDEAVDADEIEIPNRGGWSSEGESKQHKKVKEFVAANPQVVGLPRNNSQGQTEYLFASGDKADVVFETENGYLGVEVKSIISNDPDLNRGLFQAVKYQALLRSEQKAIRRPPTARAVLVTERSLPVSLQNLADVLGIAVYVVSVNSA